MERQIRSRYDDHSQYQRLTESVPEEPSLTQQQFAEDCDINCIISKFTKTGLLTHVKESQGSYGDFLKIPDYQTSLNLITQAQSDFNLLPPQLRSKFQNDPNNLINYLSQPQNQDEAIKLGLLPQKLSDDVLIIEKTTPVVIPK